jgi:TatD DNase family protein
VPPSAERIAAAHPGFVYFTAGVHPHDAAAFDPLADPPRIKEFIARGAVAVGECGLDYHYDHSPRELQRRSFAREQTAVCRSADIAPEVIDVGLGIVAER